MIRIGCAGFPQRHAICYQELDVVEVQATFYKPPHVETVQKWREEAPPKFAFTMKAWQLITHSPYIPTYQRSGMDIPAEKMSHYGSFRPSERYTQPGSIPATWRWGCTPNGWSFKCPASFRPNPGNLRNLRAFFKQVESG